MACEEIFAANSDGGWPELWSMRNGEKRLQSISLNGRSPASLVWSGDELVDWVGGGARYRLDGSHVERRVNYAFDFDMAVAHGDYAVICQRFGTKGLILRDGEILREINRSYYFASTFDFPVCLWTGASGRVLIAHCPEAYNRIEIDDVETGERLTLAPDRKPQDFFHSRLQPSPGGANLISAGWVWHPLQLLSLFNIEAALKDPRLLDDQSDASVSHSDAEQTAACWINDSLLLVAGGEAFDDEPSRGPGPTPNEILIYDVRTRVAVRNLQLDRPAGAMMMAGANAVVAFHGFPRLVSLTDGAVLREWPDLETGTRLGCIRTNTADPILALDPVNGRFAVAQKGEIHVVSI